MLSPGGARGVEKAELNGNVDSDNKHGGSSRTYVLHRTGCSQEDDQLLRQGCKRSGSPGRPGRSDPLGTGQLDEESSSTLDGGHGSNDFHRLDLRSSAAACSAGEGSASADAARHRRGQEEERSDRCRQNRRLPALRLSCQSATWHPPRFGTDGERCATDTCWCDRWCRGRIASLGSSWKRE